MLVARNISWLLKTHWNFRPACYWDRQSDLLCLEAWVSCDKTKQCVQSNVQTVCCATALSLESSMTTCLDRRWTDSLNLQAWRSLMVQTWSQYLQYIFFNKFMKSVEYWHSVRTQSVKRYGHQGVFN
jgi:hypothetical protein